MKMKTFFENMNPFRGVSELYISNNKMKRKNKTTKKKGEKFIIQRIPRKEDGDPEPCPT